jgi:uncharacterized protein YkwD
MGRLLFVAAVFASVMAGCPADSVSGLAGFSPFLNDSGTFSSSGSGSQTGGAATGSDVGPPVADSNQPADEAAISTGGTGTAVAGVDASVTNNPDALTVRFPDCETPDEAAFWRNQVLLLVNQERRRAGVEAVTWNETLAAQATQYACEMISGNFFAHDNPRTGSSLRDRAAEFNYDYWIIGENLAAGQRTPVEVVTAWMNSPCHRENVLNPAFTELGVGVRVGGTYGFYWVQEFGRPFDVGRYPGSAYHDPSCNHAE